MGFLFIDAETTGLHPDAELLELAIVDASGAVLLNTLVRPTREAEWPDATAIHGITAAHVAGAPTADELTAQVAAILRDADLVTYNAAFDTQVVPRAMQTQRATHCAMSAFTSEFGEWDEYWHERRLVSLDEAASHVLCDRRGRHRALTDAQRCRAVWRYLTVAEERHRVDAIHRADAATAEAKSYLVDEAHERACLADRYRRQREQAWMRWLRFPLWLEPGAHGCSAIELGGREAYHAELVKLVTGLSPAALEVVSTHSHLRAFRSSAEIPPDLVPLSTLAVPRWARPYITACAYYLSPSGETCRPLYPVDAMEAAYQQHPLRRAYTPAPGSALYTRTALRHAGFAPAEVDSMAPVQERQLRRAPWTWYPLYCLPVHDVRAREEGVQTSRRMQPKAGNGAAGARQRDCTILLSIKPEHAESILSGRKRFEFRRVLPRRSVQTVVLYATGGAGQVVGEFEVDAVLRAPPDSLWQQTCAAAGISRRFFDTYFSGCEQAAALVVRNPRRYEIPLRLESLIHTSKPPQSFRYLRLGASEPAAP